MEKACSSGDITAAREYFESLFRYDEESNDTIRVDIAPGAADVIGRSLCAAAKNGHVIIVKYLLDQGAAIAGDLIQAVCRAERVEMLEIMLRHGWDVNEWKDGNPPLRDALISVPCTRWLIEHGADPNPSCKGERRDLLTYAAAFEPTAIVELLVKHGAIVKGTMAMHAAAAASCRQLEDCTWDLDPLRVEVLRILLDHGANVNEMEEDPKWRKSKRPRTCFTGTPLHHMVQYGSLEAIQFLLSRGADPLHPSWSGHTVIQAAEHAGRDDVVELLKHHLECATHNPGCTPQVDMATVTVGSEPVHVRTLTGTGLFTSISSAVRSLCPDARETTSSTQCNPTGEVAIHGIDYVGFSETLQKGELVVKIPTSGYNQSSLRDAMINSIAISAQTSATGSNCFNVSYDVENLKRRSLSEDILPPSLHNWLLTPRDRPYPVREHMTMCNAAYFHTANYYNPYWRSAPLPGPSDYINALVTFHVSNSDQFLCEFLDLLVDGLMFIAPEFITEDIALEEGIDALCAEQDGGTLLRNSRPL